VGTSRGRTLVDRPEASLAYRLHTQGLSPRINKEHLVNWIRGAPLQTRTFAHDRAAHGMQGAPFNMEDAAQERR
jgi:hypothetical protein